MEKHWWGRVVLPAIHAVGQLSIVPELVTAPAFNSGDFKANARIVIPKHLFDGELVLRVINRPYTIEVEAGHDEICLEFESSVINMKVKIKDIEEMSSIIRRFIRNMVASTGWFSDRFDTVYVLLLRPVDILTVGYRESVKRIIGGDPR